MDPSGPSNPHAIYWRPQSDEEALPVAAEDWKPPLKPNFSQNSLTNLALSLQWWRTTLGREKRPSSSLLSKKWARCLRAPQLREEEVEVEVLEVLEEGEVEGEVPQVLEALVEGLVRWCANFL
jgi:hypothetical protein